MLTLPERAILQKSEQHPYEIEVSVLCRVDGWAMVQRRATARPFVCTVEALRPVCEADKKSQQNIAPDKAVFPYVAWHKDDYNASVLVFASTVQQARNTLRKAFCLTKGWHLMDIRTRRILDNPEYFLSLYTGEAVLDNPPQCAECGTWEAPLFGNQQGAQRCASCGGLSRQKTLAKK